MGSVKTAESATKKEMTVGFGTKVSSFLRFEEYLNFVRNLVSVEL